MPPNVAIVVRKIDLIAMPYEPADISGPCQRACYFTFAAAIISRDLWN
jgi:hypothetical protein